MRQPRARIASPDIQQPFASDREFGQRRRPQAAIDARMGIDQRLEIGSRDIGDDAMGQRLDVVIGHAEKQVLEADKVAGHLQPDQRAPAVDRQFLPRDIALDQEGAVRSGLALPDEVGRRGQRANIDDQSPQGATCGIIERMAVVQHMRDASDRIENRGSPLVGGSTFSLSVAVTQGRTVQTIPDRTTYGARRSGQMSHRAAIRPIAQEMRSVDRSPMRSRRS
jgi:hypothetical protein